MAPVKIFKTKIEKLFLFLGYPFIYLFEHIDIFLILIILTAFLSQSITNLREISYSIKWALLLLFIVIEFLILKLITLERNEKYSLLSKDHLILSIFPIFILITAPFSIAPASSLVKSVSITVLLFGTFVIIPFFSRDRKIEIKILDKLVWTSYAILLINLLSLIVGLEGSYSAYIHFRARGIFENANTLGLFCSISFPLLLYKNLVSKIRKVIYLNYFFLFILIVLSIASFSRSSLVSMVISFLVYSYFYHRKIFYLSLGTGVVIGILVLLSPTLLIALRLAGDPLSFRGTLWEMGYDAWQKNKILGTGFGTSEIITKNKYLFMQKSLPLFLSGKHLHNMYLEILAETGLLGSIFFIGFIMKIINNTFRNFHLPNLKVIQLSKCYLALLFGVIVQSIFESFLFSAGTVPGIMFWTFTGIVFSKSMDGVSLQNAK